MDFAELCDEAWDSSVDVAADCVEAYARVKDVFGDDDSCDDDCRPRRRGGDFLYELLHLNVTYAMQLARLCSSYSVYAHRALGALYGLYAAPRSRRSRVLSYVGVAYDKPTRVLRVKNCSDEEAVPEVKLETFRSRDDDELDIELVQISPRDPIEPGQTVRLGIQVRIPDAEPGRYRGRLKLILGKRRQFFPVVVCIERASR